MEKQYKYLGFFLSVLVPVTVIAFFKTYFSQFPYFAENITVLTHVHAVLALTWIVMLIIQPILIVQKKILKHRLIGKLSYIVFPLLVLSFIPQILKVLHSDSAEFAVFPLSDSILLIFFYAMAVYHRRKPSKHMRYMIGTALVFLAPTIGRIGPIVLGWSDEFSQYFLYGLVYLILLVLILYDKKNKREYQPYSIILVAWILHYLTITIVISQTN